MVVPAYIKTEVLHPSRIRQAQVIVSYLSSPIMEITRHLLTMVRRIRNLITRLRREEGKAVVGFTLLPLPFASHTTGTLITLMYLRPAPK